MLKQIEFSTDNIGKPGVIHKFRNGEIPYQIVWEDGWRYIVAITSNGDSPNVYKNGLYLMSGEADYDLLQYIEVKELSPEEWWGKNFQIINTSNGDVFRGIQWHGFNCLITAIKSGEVVL